MIRRISLLALVFLTNVVLAKNDPPLREFRAVWVATVANIDWPSKKGLSVEEQKAEFIKLADMHHKNGMNALIVQVRPAADAFYNSDLEPWSEYLMGEQGKAPTPTYDPLKFMIEETHKRCMEFHAWFNPYRVVVDSKNKNLSENHICNKHPEWLLKYGNREYFDPGIPAARDFTVKVIKDVVKRYDVDAIHFDDYFYPYKIWKKEFPDTASFAKYKGEYTKETKDDWRRNNVNTIIKMLNDTIKSVKPYVKFGISPFGVWRNKDKDPKGSATKAGQTNYDDLYADVLLWLKEGWIDYILPQVYWHIGKKVADYKIITDWWCNNHFNKHLYIGHGVYRMDKKSKTKAWRKKDEIIKQIELNREKPEILGSAYFSSKTFFKNPRKINKRLKKRVYKYAALVPPMPELDDKAPDSPEGIKVKTESGKKVISWNKQNDAWYYVVYKLKKGEEPSAKNIIGVVKNNKIDIAKRSWLFRKKYTIKVAALDRLHNQSKLSKGIKTKI